MFKNSVIDTELKYYTAATYNVIDSIIGCSINVTLDGLPVIFMSCAVAMVNGLSRRIEKIGQEIKVTALKKVDQRRPHAKKLVQTVDKEKLHFKELVRCVEIHLKLKEFTREIEDHFSTIILVQGLMSSVIFCTTMYLLSSVSEALIKNVFI